MFRTILVYHQEQLYKLYIAFGIGIYRHILRYLFCELLEEIAGVTLCSFLYGNGIEHVDAVLLISACNPSWHWIHDDSILRWFYT